VPRYIARPALANERAQTNAAGQVVLKLKTAWRDGTDHLVLSPLEFMQRLAALSCTRSSASGPGHERRRSELAERRPLLHPAHRTAQHRLAFRKPAEVAPQTEDRYGRTITRVECAGVDASQEQVSADGLGVYEVLDRQQHRAGRADRTAAGHGTVAGSRSSASMGMAAATVRGRREHPMIDRFRRASP
jgi:hypothetical protein